MYVDNVNCPEETYVYREPAKEQGKGDLIYVDWIPIRTRAHRGVSPPSLNGSSDEEEIRVRERRDTVVTVGKRKSTRGKKSSRK